MSVIPKYGKLYTDPEKDKLVRENARLTAILYSVMKRHPDVDEWNLELSGVSKDELPDRILVGWNTVGDDAILTLVFGETLRQLDTREEENASTED